MAITEKYVTSAGAGSGDGSSEANARSWANMISDINAGTQAGVRFNVKGSVSRTTTTDTITGGGTITSPVIIRGYSSTIGDGYQGRTNSNGLLITTNMPAISYTTGRFFINGSSFIILESLNISGAGNNVLVTLSSDCKMKSCVVANAGNGSSNNGVFCSFQRATVFDSDVSNSGTTNDAACFLNANGCKIIGGRFTSVSGYAIGLQAMNQVLKATVFSAATYGIAIKGTGAHTIIGDCTIVSASSDGINVITGTTGTQDFFNNMITDCTTNGLNMVSTSNGAFCAYNRYRDNGTNRANAGDWLTATNYGDVTSGNGTTDYTNAVSGDYSLKQTSPAVGAGIPYAASIGALQRPAGGGIFHRGMQGGFNE